MTTRFIVMFSTLALGSTLALNLIWASPTQSADVTDYYRVVHEQSLVQALMLLEQTTAKASVDDILKRNVKIVFKDLRQLGKVFKNDDALSWLMDDGSQLIFISVRHEQAPPQALAAIISHEIMHNDQDNSVMEEIAGWQRELRTWRELKAMYPELGQLPNGRFPLVDRLNAIDVLSNQQKLTSTIENHPAYKGLQKHSPGF